MGAENISSLAVAYSLCYQKMLKHVCKIELIGISSAPLGLQTTGFNIALRRYESYIVVVCYGHFSASSLKVDDFY